MRLRESDNAKASLRAEPRRIDLLSGQLWAIMARCLCITC